MIHYYTPKELLEGADNENETEEARDKIAEANEEIEKQNELFAKLKQYVKLVTPDPEAEEPESMEADYEAAEEKCLVRVQNYRDPPVIDAMTDN